MNERSDYKTKDIAHSFRQGKCVQCGVNEEDSKIYGNSVCYRTKTNLRGEDRNFWKNNKNHYADIDRIVMEQLRKTKKN